MLSRIVTDIKTDSYELMFKHLLYFYTNMGIEAKRVGNKEVSVPSCFGENPKSFIFKDNIIEMDDAFKCCTEEGVILSKPCCCSKFVSYNRKAFERREPKTHILIGYDKKDNEVFKFTINIL